MLNVLHYVSRMDRAGQETFLMNLFRKIDREKIQFDFLCSEQAEGAYDPEIRGAMCITRKWSRPGDPSSNSGNTPH